jgi:hypothetical protein
MDYGTALYYSFVAVKFEHIMCYAGSMGIDFDG